MTKVLFILLFLATVGSLRVQAEETKPLSEPESLVSVRISYKEEIKKATARIRAGYQGALEKLIKELGAKGDIDGALAVKREYESQLPGITDTKAIAAADSNNAPEELASLRSKYDAGMRAIVDPITFKYRDYLLELKKNLGGAGELDSAKLVQAEIEKLGLPEKPSLNPGTGGRDRVVIWNQINGGKNDRGSSKANVILYNGGAEVWRKNNVSLSWIKDQDASTEIEIPILKTDRVRVEITEYHSRGGGLSEIEFIRGGKNLAKGCRAMASAFWETNEEFSPSKVTDGNRSGLEIDDGFWLLPNQTAGWIEIMLNQEKG